jgi:diguanylate cyclase
MTSPTQPAYTDSFDQASETLRRVLPLMTKHGVPPHPHNFSVWYEYATGSNPLLTETIDQLVRDSNPFTDELNQELYLRFIARDEVYLEQTRQVLRRVVMDIRDKMREAGGELAVYGSTLERYADALETAHNLEQITQQTQYVLVETRSTEDSQQRLDEQLSSVVREVEALRRELEQIREETLIDGLTGVGNRKAFDTALARAVQTAIDTRSPLSVLMVDIDRFKSFNDNFGHLIGDRVLRFVAATLRSCIKGNDKPARFGGEEFAVILPRTFLSGATSVAEQIRHEVAAGELKDKRSGVTFGRITVSIGVAQYRLGETDEELLNRVDQALYQAKQRGRNRAVQAP